MKFLIKQYVSATISVEIEADSHDDALALGLFDQNRIQKLIEESVGKVSCKTKTSVHPIGMDNGPLTRQELLSKMESNGSGWQAIIPSDVMGLYWSVIASDTSYCDPRTYCVDPSEYTQFEVALKHPWLWANLRIKEITGESDDVLAYGTIDAINEWINNLINHFTANPDSLWDFLYVEGIPMEHIKIADTYKIAQLLGCDQWVGYIRSPDGIFGFRKDGSGVFGVVDDTDKSFPRFRELEDHPDLKKAVHTILEEL